MFRGAGCSDVSSFRIEDPTRSLPLHWLCAPLLSVALYSLCLGTLPLQLPDESREAEVAREVWVGPPLQVPHLNGKAYVIKTPLAYWTAELGFEAAGDPVPSEWLVRLPSALFTLGTAAFTFLLGLRWFSTRHGLMAALILCCTPSVLSHGRRFTADPALAMFVTVAVGAALLAMTAEGRRRFGAWVFLAGSALALAFLAKGPMGVALVGSGTAGALMAERGLRGLPALRVATAAVAMLVLLAPAVLLWTWMLQHQGGAAMIDYYLSYHTRGFRPTELNQALAMGPTPHVESWWFYAARGPDGFLPWLLLLPLFALAAPERGERLRAGPEPAARPGLRLLGWFLLPLLFLSLLAQKRELYLLPLYPPLALAAACALLDPLPARWPRVSRAARVVWMVMGAGAWVGAGLLLAGGVVYAVSHGLYGRAVLGIALLACAGALPLLARRDPLERDAPLPYPFAGASAVALLALGLLVFVEPVARADRTIRPFAREVAEHLQRDPGTTLYGYRITDDVGRIEGAVAFELGRTFPTLERPEELRELLARTPRARVIMDQPVWEAEGKPGRVIADLGASRRRLVLIAPR